ncbi:hypothetical protein [Halosimplex amylolyticum]|uniref:hypothetical protein n=1 Tax=Halosimplex amylolyticum TaxID=3396616 RepID=UPI003F54CF16
MSPLLALDGLLTPIGILSGIYLGLPPALVSVGAVSITTATALFALEVVQIDDDGSMPSKLERVTIMFEVEFNGS